VKTSNLTISILLTVALCPEVYIASHTNEYQMNMGSGARPVLEDDKLMDPCEPTVQAIWNP
jgi:hypothetical protein